MRTTTYFRLVFIGAISKLIQDDKDWTKPDGQLVERYYFTDFLHLVEEGYEKFANSIYEAIVKVLQGNAVGFGTEESENELNKTKEIENKKKR